MVKIYIYFSSTELASPGCSNHFILHLPSLECRVHSLQAFTFHLLVLLGLRRSKHTILHQPPLECPVHSLQAVRVPTAFQVFGRLEDPSHRIINTHPNGMTPRGDGGLAPISSFDRSHELGGINKFCVSFYGDEVRVCPFFVQESQIAFILFVKWNLPVIPLAPS